MYYRATKLHLSQSVMYHVTSFYFLMKRDGKLCGRVHSTEYKRSPFPEGGLKVLIEVTIACDDKINLSKIKSLIAESYEVFDSVKGVEHIDSDDVSLA